MEAQEARGDLRHVKWQNVGIRNQVSWRVGRSNRSCVARLLPKTPQRKTWWRTCGTDSVFS